MSKATLSFAVVFLSFSALLMGCSKSQEEKKPAFRVEQESPEAAALAKQKTKESAPVPKGKFKTFRVYTDANSPDNHYAPSGWMGDWGDIKLDAAYMENPHSGTTSIKVVYTAQKTQGANWAGIYWQNPPNN